MAPAPGPRRYFLRVLYLVFDEAGESWATGDPEEAAAWTAGEEPIFLRATAATAGGRVVARAGEVFPPSTPWAPATPERLRLAAKRLTDALVIGLPTRRASRRVGER